MTGLLAGKVVLVVGGSTGIGADSARLFAEEGASVMLAARSKDALAALTDGSTADLHGSRGCGSPGPGAGGTPPPGRC
jgi:NADP-dependent 3-hydroxy acid dehydrogenase YdfG